MIAELLVPVASNVAIATLLGVAAALVARWARRPALVHGLCLLALLKLVTPAWLPVPVLPAEPGRDPALAAALVRFDALRAATDDPAPFLAATLPATPAVGVPRSVASADPTPFPWSDLLLGIWAFGTALVVGRALIGALRFRRIVRSARPADRDQRTELATLARRVGLRRHPDLLVVPFRASPMLASVGRRTAIVVPEGLASTMTTEARHAVLTHELAHFARRDHWVRAFELVVVSAFWWLPVAWWLRTMLRDAEEQCCDAWVVWARPGHARCYADALIDTAAFLSTRESAIPPLASGAVRTRHLRERLEMILHAKTPRKLSGSARAAILLLAAATLSALPSAAQEPEAARAARLDAMMQRIEALEAQVRAFVDAEARRSSPPVADSTEAPATRERPPFSPPVADDAARSLALASALRFLGDAQGAANADVAAQMIALRQLADLRTANGAADPARNATLRSLLTRVDAEADAGRFAVAQRALERALALDPDNAAAHTAFGQLMIARAVRSAGDSGDVASRMYTVRVGDTLAKIAKEAYGSPKYWRLIADANDIDPMRLEVGQRLVVPPQSDDTEPQDDVATLNARICDLTDHIDRLESELAATRSALDAVRAKRKPGDR